MLVSLRGLNSRIDMKARWFWLIVLVALSLATVGTVVWTAQIQRAAQLDMHLARARAAADEGKWQLAAQELRIVLKLDPESAAACLMLADVTFRAGRIQEALQAVRRVPSRSANGVPARLLEGTLLIMVGEASRAEAVLNECLALDSTSIEARRRLVFLYGIELRREELRRVLWELHALGATEATDLVLLSGSTFIVWNAKEIMGTIERFAEADPQHVPARIALGYYRRRQNDFDGARRDLFEACRLAPTDCEAHVALLDCLFDQDDLDEASRILSRVPNEWHEDGRLLYFRGRMAERAGEFERAIQWYRDAIAMDPDHRESRYHVGQLLLQAGHDEEAHKHLDHSRKLAERESLLGTLLDTRDPSRYAPQVARLERALGHDRLADVWFAEAVKLNPHDTALRSEVEQFAARYGPICERP
jgi:tetratricopeptide (TPR) repeat protein